MKLAKKNVSKQREILNRQIKTTQLALETAYSNFNNATEPELIDCFIYEVNAMQQKYQYLIQQIKQLDNDLNVKQSSSA